MKKRMLSILLCLLLTIISVGCGGSGTETDSEGEQGDYDLSTETVTLNIAYQYGLAYAPLIVCEQQGLIESAYKEATGKDVKVVWNQMSSGADINTAVAAGEIDVGFMGVAPAITGIMKGVGYKIFTNLSGQEHGLMTNKETIGSLKDLIGSDEQIALVNIGSIQHIILAKALDDAGYDAHVLDSNIVAMKHPDGMSSLESGNIACHLTSNPYIYMEREEMDLFEIAGISEAWPVENSFIVGVAAETLFDEDPDLYDSLCAAISTAIDYVNNNLEETAALTCEYDGNTEEEELNYLSKGIYSTQTKGVFELATFMARTEFIEKTPESYNDLVFSNVVGD